MHIGMCLYYAKLLQDQIQSTPNIRRVIAATRLESFRWSEALVLQYFLLGTTWIKQIF